MNTANWKGMHTTAASGRALLLTWTTMKRRGRRGNKVSVLTTNTNDQQQQQHSRKEVTINCTVTLPALFSSLHTLVHWSSSPAPPPPLPLLVICRRLARGAIVKGVDSSAFQHPFKSELLLLSLHHPGTSNEQCAVPTAGNGCGCCGHWTWLRTCR